MKRKTEFFKTPAGMAVAAAFAMGLLVHLFGLVNILHNNDDIWQMPMGYGTGISSGRWLLTILGDLFMRLGMGFNLSVVNGVLFLAMVAVSAGLVVDIFRVRKPVSAVLMGMLFAVFPSVTSVLFFKYTAVYYGIAVLLSVLAVWLLEKSRLGLLWSALCTACAMGIYQAYVPVTITIFVLLLIQQALSGEADVKKLVRRGLYFCAVLILGLVLYFAFLKVSLAVYATSLSDYQGVDNMGKISLSMLPTLLKRTLGGVVKLVLYDYCGLAGSSILKLLYVLSIGASAFLVLYILLAKVKKPIITAAAMVLCAVLPFAVNFVVIMCPDTVLYTLMVYSFVLIPCAPLILLESLPSGEESKVHKIMGKAVAVIAAVMVFCYGYDANVNYTTMYFGNRQVENYWNSIVTQVRMTEGFEPEMEWALIGEIQDPMINNSWEYIEIYGGNRHGSDLMNQYSRLAWVNNYMGIKVPQADEEKTAELAGTSEVRDMPCWPSQGSIQIIEDTVVIKFQNLE